MSAAAIIWIVLCAIRLTIAAILDGEPLVGKHKFSLTFIGTLIAVSLLLWGGFFSIK